MNLYVLYGPPGTGKSTFCRFLSKYNFLYLDIGSHPSFRKKKMCEIAVEIASSFFNKNINFNHVITEGVFSDLKRRYEFINYFINNIKFLSFDNVYTIYIYIMMLIHYVNGEKEHWNKLNR